MFRVQRIRHELPGGRARYILRGVPITGRERGDGGSGPVEVVLETGIEDLRDKLASHHAIPTPEHNFEHLWQRLRVDLDGL